MRFFFGAPSLPYCSLLPQSLSPISPKTVVLEKMKAGLTLLFPCCFPLASRNWRHRRPGVPALQRCTTVLGQIQSRKVSWFLCQSRTPSWPTIPLCDFFVYKSLFPPSIRSQFNGKRNPRVVLIQEEVSEAQMATKALKCRIFSSPCGKTLDSRMQATFIELSLNFVSVRIHVSFVPLLLYLLTMLECSLLTWPTLDFSVRLVGLIKVDFIILLSYP